MNTWSLTGHGLRTVVSLEIKQRLRSKRWLWALIAWFLLIGAITVLTMWSMYRVYRNEWTCYEEVGQTTCKIMLSPAGPMAFSVIVMFILGMGLVVAPAFTATSINGDRSLGILATLQATRLSAVEIVAGKLIAAWMTAAAFLVSASPFIILSLVLGNISILQVIVCLVVIFVLIAIVCAIGLGWSSIFTRAAASTVMTYVSTVLLALISPLILVMVSPFLEEHREVQVWGLTDQQWREYNEALDKYWVENPDGEASNSPLPPMGECQWNTKYMTQNRLDRAWWLLVPNPFVVVADAAPLSPYSQSRSGGDLLSSLRYAVRELSRPPATEIDECTDLYNWNPSLTVEYLPNGTKIVSTLDGVPVNIPPSPVAPRPPSEIVPVWPLGLGINLIVGAIFFSMAVVRLQIPYKKLAKGTRVA